MAVPETKAVHVYRKAWIEKLKHRRSDIRSGSQRPVDQNNQVIMQSDLDIGDSNSPPASLTVSLLATRGANGELTRMIRMLEEEEEKS